MHYAAHHDHAAIVELLLKTGGNQNATNSVRQVDNSLSLLVNIFYLFQS